MKNARPAFPRSLSRSFESAFWTSVLGALVVGLIQLIPIVDRMDHPLRAVRSVDLQIPTMGVVAAFGLLAGLLALQGFFFPLSSRYEIGATDLTVRTGTLWRHTTTLPLVGITRIDAVSGPLMRILGLTDLRVYTMSTIPAQNGAREWASATLLGLRDGEEVRRFLLERRDTLHESVLRGDLSVARSPQELQMERLTTALERLEHRLPKA